MKSNFLTRKMTYIVIVGLAALLLVWSQSGKRKKKMVETIPFFSEISSTNTFKIKRITQKGVVYHFASEFDHLLENTTKNESKRFDGRIYFDTINHSFWITTFEHKKSDETGLYVPVEEWVNFNLEGRIIERKPKNMVSNAPGVLLKNEISNFYNWNDRSLNLHVKKFIKDRYNWNQLNPFNGWGSPTASFDSRKWMGTAILNLKYNNEEILFKVKTATTDFGYRFVGELYLLPNTEDDVLLLYLTDREDGVGLYLITM